VTPKKEGGREGEEYAALGGRGKKRKPNVQESPRAAKEKRYHQRKHPPFSVWGCRKNRKGVTLGGCNCEKKRHESP